MTNGERLPKNINKAIRILCGFCQKNERCEECRMKGFCDNEKDNIPAYWNEWMRKEVDK